MRRDNSSNGFKLTMEKKSMRMIALKNSVKSIESSKSSQHPSIHNKMEWLNGKIKLFKR